MEVFLHPSILKTDGSKYLLNRSFRLRQINRDPIGCGSAALVLDRNLFDSDPLIKFSIKMRILLKKIV